MKKIVPIILIIVFVAAGAAFAMYRNAAATEIKITSPRPNDRVESPLVVIGEARGYWFFEGIFPVTLLDAEGNALAETYATTPGEWMTEDFIPFESRATFQTPPTATGTLLIQNDNPSGLPEYAREARIPVRFK